MVVQQATLALFNIYVIYVNYAQLAVYVREGS